MKAAKPNWLSAAIVGLLRGLTSAIFCFLLAMTSGAVFIVLGVYSIFGRGCALIACGMWLIALGSFIRKGLMRA